MGAEVDVLCGAARGTAVNSSERTNSRKGYRHRDFDIRAAWTWRCRTSLGLGALAVGCTDGYGRFGRVQLGAAAELAADLGWPADALDFERGEFDILGHARDGPAALAVEAKARPTGADRLDTMLREWLTYPREVWGDEMPATNARRKYRELLRL